MLELETPALAKQYFLRTAHRSTIDAPAKSTLDAAFDPEVYFERWLADVTGNRAAQHLRGSIPTKRFSSNQRDRKREVSL